MNDTNHPMQALLDSVDQLPEVLTVYHLTRIYNVSSRSVIRWTEEGRLSSFRTPGGQRRYLKSDIIAAIKGSN